MEPRTSENAFKPLREAEISDSVLTHPALGGNNSRPNRPISPIPGKCHWPVTVHELKAFLNNSFRKAAIMAPDGQILAPNTYDAEPIPDAARSEIERLLTSGDL